MEKIINYFRKQLHGLKKSSPKQLLYSFGIAFISWFIISITMYSTTPQTISNIPLVVDITGTSAEANNLSVISQDADNVKAKLTIDRTQLNSLSNKNLIAKAKVENVTQAGIYQLKIDITSTEDVEFTVENTDPAYVTVEFDSYITKEIPITVNAPNIKVKDGYIMDETSPQVTPSTINITGPQKQVDSISQLCVNINETKALDNYYTYHSNDTEQWKLYNENGSEVNADGLTFDLNDIQVDFQAYMTKTLKLKYNLINAPFNDFVPDFTMSVDEIVVASSDSSLEDREEIPLGDIDMREVDINYSKEFKIELQPSYRNISGVDTVTVSLNSNKYTKREFSNLTNFVLLNIPSDYDVEVLSENLTVELIAPSSVIDEITQDDFVLKIDLSNAQITGSLFNGQVMVQLPDYPNAWCVGKYSVALRATEKNSTTNVTTETSTSSVVLY